MNDQQHIYPEHSPAIKDMVQTASKIVVVQADNPDGDSLASSLALEQILGELGKDVMLYCSIDVPEYLRHLDGWDRVAKYMPSMFDLAILVDTSATTLLDNANQDKTIAQLKNKPLIVLDHHAAESTIDYAQVIINDKSSVATGQVIYNVCQDNDWEIDSLAAGFLASSILSDTLGLTSSSLLDNSQPFRVMAELVDRGANISELNLKRLEASKIDSSLIHFKGELLQRIEFHNDYSVASLDISHAEIIANSQNYNPTTVLDELRFAKGVKLTLGFKQYLDKNGNCRRITVRIRCMPGIKVAQTLAQAFGGDGHVFASGIKIEGSELDFDDFKQQVISEATRLINATD